MGAWQQAWLFGTTFLFMRQVEGISSEEDHYRLQLSDGGAPDARTVVITTGGAYRRLGVPKLEQLQGRGVFYGAATSEAPAMRGRTAVVGGGNSAGQAAMHLAKWATQVQILVRGESLTQGMSDYLIREIETAPNVSVTYRVQVVDGTGTDHLESLVLEDERSGTRQHVPADALFVLIGSQPLANGSGTASHATSGVSSSLGWTFMATPEAAGAPTAPRCRLRRACPGVRRRGCATRIGQTSRFGGRRGCDCHPAGPPLPGKS